MSSRLTDRALRAFPWVMLILTVLVFFWVEAALRTTPWDFTDELEWSQLSRAIASTGHAARRGEPHTFKSIYSFLIAPAWWLHSTSAAYSTIKFLNATLMALAAVPTYLLSRLLISRRSAVIVALLSIAIPATSYATSIVPESLAYLWFTSSTYLTIRALATPTTRTIGPAIVVAVVGLWVRPEFVTLPAALALAAALLWVAREGGERALRQRLPRVGLSIVGLVVFGYVFNHFVVERVRSWQFSQFINGDTLHYGGLAAGALAIGLGVGPVIAGLAALWLPERFRDPAYRAFAAYAFSVIAVLFVYTAGKSAYLADSFGRDLIEERNLFFLSPLLLLGTALTLEARRVDWRLAGVGALIALLVAWSGKLVVGQPYFEAPGLSMLTIANRDFYWDINAFHWVLIGLAGFWVGLLALRRLPRIRLLAALFAGAWLLTGQIYVTRSNDAYADKVFGRLLPPPRSWVDTATHGKHVTFLGQAIADQNKLWELEFWNRSLDRVESLDGSAAGPGPAPAPALLSTDGSLGDYTGNPYTLAGPGVVLDAPVVARRDVFTLYSTPKPWHLLEEEQNVYGDGWASNPIGYTYFKAGGPGTLRVVLSRTAYRGNGPPVHVTVRFGATRLDQSGVPEIGQAGGVRHSLLRNGHRLTLLIEVASTPVTVAVTVLPTVPRAADPRGLAAQPAFSFTRGR